MKGRVRHAIPIGEWGETTAWFHEPEAEPRRIVLLGHGAGGRAEDSVLIHLADALAERGARVVRFDFLYRAQGRKAPDRMPKLVATFQAVLEHALRLVPPATELHLGGKSMGGRVAAYVARERSDVTSLFFLGYPLVPKKARPESLASRRALLLDQDRNVPLLFLTGTRDDFAPGDQLERLVDELGERATLHRIEGADHGFSVRSRDARTDAQVLEELAAHLTLWLDREPPT